MGPPAAGTADYLLKLERDMASGFLHLLLLATLRDDGPLHGYGLIKALGETTGRGLWKEGTIYPILGTLEGEGLVKSRWGEPKHGPRRKYYELTSAGRQVLRVAIVQWKEFQSAVNGILEETQ